MYTKGDDFIWVGDQEEEGGIIRHGRRDSSLSLRSLLWYSPVRPHRSVKGAENPSGDRLSVCFIAR